MFCDGVYNFPYTKDSHNTIPFDQEYVVTDSCPFPSHGLQVGKTTSGHTWVSLVELVPMPGYLQGDSWRTKADAPVVAS